MKSLITKYQTILLLLSKVSGNCSDHRVWKDSDGLSCYNYKFRYCGGGRLKTQFQYHGGQEYGFPELNCCACGKGDPTYYAAPSKHPYSCTHIAANSISRQMVEYCAEANSGNNEYSNSNTSSNSQQCTDSGRSVHCAWNPAIYYQSFGPGSDWNVSKYGYLVGANPYKYKIYIDKEDCGRYCTREKEWCKSFDYGLVTRHCNLYNISYFEVGSVQMISDSRAMNKFEHFEIFSEVPDRTPGHCTHFAAFNQ
jgi:hypothetical protein